MNSIAIATELLPRGEDRAFTSTFLPIIIEPSESLNSARINSSSLLTGLCIIMITFRGSSILGKLTDHVAVRPRRGEGRLHNYNYWQYLAWGGGGGSWVSLGGGGGELSCLGGGGGGGGKLPLRPPP